MAIAAAIAGMLESRAILAVTLAMQAVTANMLTIAMTESRINTSTTSTVQRNGCCSDSSDDKADKYEGVGPSTYRGIGLESRSGIAGKNLHYRYT